uniref:Uncharacterized protein n=1 Tax=Sus scrofa TaxID=9823 RepID=A0A4X1TJA9_PIG
MGDRVVCFSPSFENKEPPSSGSVPVGLFDNTSFISTSLLLSIAVSSYQTAAECRPVAQTPGLSSSNSPCLHKEDNQEEKRDLGFRRTKKFM